MPESSSPLRILIRRGLGHVIDSLKQFAYDEVSVGHRVAQRPLKKPPPLM